MKKLLLTICLLFTTYFTQAQFYGGGVFCSDCYSSIEAGGILSNISGLDGGSSKTGFYFGVYQYRYISDSFSFRSGISYNNLGAKVEGFDDPLVIHSINFPLILHYTYDYKFQGFVGGEIGTNFFGKLPAYSSSDSFDHTFEFSENFTLLDASVFIGVGYILIDNIDINLKYNYGVTDINKNPEESDLKKNWLTLSIGYTFRD